MMRCAESQADVIIDGIGYLLTSRAELKALERRLSGMAGVKWTHREQTGSRLWKEDREKRSSLGFANGAPDAHVEKYKES